MALIRCIFVCLGIVILSACASTQVRHPDYGQDCSDLTSQGGLGGLITNVDCVRVFYGTNRVVLAGDADAGGENDTLDVLPKPGDNLVLGRADIWLPKLVSDGGTRELGDTPMLKGEIPEDKKQLSKYVFITRITKNGKTNFVQSLEKDMDDRNTRSVLLFIHGFNVQFESALIRSAQLSVDLGVEGTFNPGTPVLFSWPSAGEMSLGNYLKDGKKADSAAPYLTEFLDILTIDVDIMRINIIAHSMGNRVLVTALEDYAADYLRTHPKANIEFRIILAAADVERDIFDQVAGKLDNLDANFTIYTSDDDLALSVSKIINGEPRLGDTDNNKPYIREKEGFETVDATSVATELFGLGHGYYSSNPFILGDILCALAGTPYEERALALRHYDDRMEAPEFFRTNPEIEPDYAECSLTRSTIPNNDPDISFGYGMGNGRGLGGGAGTSGGDFGGGKKRGLGAGRAREPEAVIAPPVMLESPASAAPEWMLRSSQQLMLYFDLGASSITEQNKTILESNFLEREDREYTESVTITGFTDRVGNAEFNLRLSRKRAQAVADYLAEMGVDTSLITVTAFGEKDGFIETDDEIDEPLNRRVEVLIEYE